MTIKFSKIDTETLHAIQDARPILEMKRIGEQVASMEASFGVPHEIFVLGLEEIVRSSDPFSGKATLIRVIETNRDEARALYEVSTSEQGKAQVQGMTNAAETLKNLEKGLRVAADIADNINDDAELRFVRVPALYVEAIWLHYSNDTRDIFIPINAMDIVQEFRPVVKVEFLDRLRRAARERLERSRDDTGAP